MFYSYMCQLPVVADNAMALTRGTRLEFEMGSLRKAKADQDGFRCFVLFDKARGVHYRVTGKGLLVEYDSSSSEKNLFIPTRTGILKHTAFAMEGEAAEVNSFLVLTDKINEEYLQSRSLWNRVRKISQDPLGRLFIWCLALYGLVTLAVLFFG